jgi:hypothetical protein
MCFVTSSGDAAGKCLTASHVMVQREEKALCRDGISVQLPSSASVIEGTEWVPILSNTLFI